MKNLIMSLMLTVCFVTVSIAQQKEVVKETITKEVKDGEMKAECKDHKHGEVKKCDGTGKKECCAKKGEMKAECKDHKHGDAKTGDATCKKECCAKKGEMKAECKDHKHGDAKKCEPGCTMPCCATKKVDEVKEVIKVKETGKMTYACPMKCEGTKTYANEGKCPKCNMFLKPAKS